MRLNRKMTAGHVLLLLLIWQAAASAAVPDGQAGSCYHANGTGTFLKILHKDPASWSGMSGKYFLTKV
jgi:hypothetical protein